MPKCKYCVHWEACREYVTRLAAARGVDLGATELEQIFDSDDCDHFHDSSRFVELKSAEWIEDEDICGYLIYRCSNCNERFVLEEGTPLDNCYFYCPNCGAKMDERALKEREAT